MNWYAGLDVANSPNRPSWRLNAPTHLGAEYLSALKLYWGLDQELASECRHETNSELLIGVVAASVQMDSAKRRLGNKGPRRIKAEHIIQARDFQKVNRMQL